MLAIKPVLIVLALFSLIVTPAFAEEILSVKSGYLKLEPAGHVAVSVPNVDGTEADLKDDLGGDDSSSVFLEAALQLGSFRLFAAYLPIRFSGDSVLAKKLDFNGETFVLGSRVESEVDINIYEAGLSWFLLKMDSSAVRVQFGPEVAVKYVDARVELKSNAFGLNESESFGAPVPTVGVRGKLGLADWLGVAGRIGFMECDSSSFMDVDAQLEVSPLPLFGLFAGYRYLDINIDESDVLIDATFTGPYAGALIRF